MRKYRGVAVALAVMLLLGCVNAAAYTGLVAENLELETYRGVSVGGQLSANAAKDAKLLFEITTEPCKGRVEVQEDGHFVYTPEEGRRGRDYFGYKAMDEKGNVSQEATVIIHLMKCRTTFRYEDTAGLACDYAAHVMAAEGLLQGQSFAGNYVFEPENNIHRGEFLTLCMAAAGVSPLQGVRSTGYRDDDAIDGWLKPYVSTALLAGYTEKAAAFDADTAITRGEAACILDAVFAITDAPGSAADEESRAVMNLAAGGIPLAAGDTFLTRGEAAMMLVEAMK